MEPSVCCHAATCDNAKATISGRDKSRRKAEERTSNLKRQKVMADLLGEMALITKFDLELQEH
jgi:hypothetical protein